MLDHLDDLHADYWAIWGIDIHRDTTLTGPEFFAMARRTFSYDGMMTARLRAQEEQEQQQAPVSQPQTPSPTPQSSGAKVVDLATFRQMFPDVTTHSTT